MAMSVFLVAITVAVGSFVQALKTQRTVNHLLEINSNTSIAIEQIAREIRTGHSFSFKNLQPGDCPAPQFEELEFTNSRSNKVFYHEEDGAIVRRECAGTDCAAANFEPMTASNVKVERLCFTNTGNLNNNKDPWRITLFLKVGSVAPQLAGSKLNLQTTVAARILPQDLPID